MNHAHDIRWKQRFNNYVSALRHLSAAVEESEQRELSNLEKQGLIKNFEVVYELAYNVLKDYLKYDGVAGIGGSRDAARIAFEQGIIKDGQTWIDMISTRNETIHTYKTDVLEAIFTRIIHEFHPCFLAFQKHFNSIYERETMKGNSPQ